MSRRLNDSTRLSLARISSVALVLTGVFAATSLRAQQPVQVPPPLTAGAAQQGARQTRDFERQQRQLQSRTNPTRPHIAAPAPAPPAPAGPSFHLNRIVTNHSGILSAGEIARALAPYRDRQVTIADLDRAVAALNRLYAGKGMITARAVLPKQRVEDGIVHIELIEARLGRVAILGARDTKAQFFLNRIQARPGDLLRLQPLRHDLILLNDGNGIQTRALLQPGKKFGTTDLILQVSEPEKVVLHPSFDNAGRDSIGLQRIGFTAANNSVFGDRDVLSAGVFYASGTRSASLSYDMPLTAGGLRMALSGDYAGIRILSGQLKTLGITGNSTDFSWMLTQPLVAREGLIVSGFGGYQALNSVTHSGGLALSNQFVQAANFGVRLQAFDRQGAWFANDAITAGHVNVKGRGRFAKESLAVARQEIMGEGVIGIIRFAGQVRLSAPAGVGLPLVEQMQMGGLATVRGYPEGWEIADTGYTLTNELDFPLPLRQYFFGGSFSRGLQGAIFADRGGIFGLAGQHRGPHATPRDLYLTSAGIGVIFDTPYLAGRLDWAAPLENRDGLPKVGFDFYLQPRIKLWK